MTVREAQDFMAAVDEADRLGPDLPMSRLDILLAALWVFITDLAHTIQRALGF